MQAMTRSDRNPLTLALIIGLSGLVAWLGLATVRDVLMQWDLGQAPNPYFIPARALSLYVVTPLAALGATLFFLAPGLILSATFGRQKSLALWLITGFGASLVVMTAAITLFQLATGIILTGAAFLGFVAALTLICLLILALRLAQGQGLRLALQGQSADIWTALALTWATLVLLSPKFYWENFSGDGSGALQFARCFIHTLWPFWSPDAGVIKQAPGLTSVLFVLPESWYVRLWGEWEFSARAPLLMGLLLLYPVLIAMIRHGRPAAHIRPTDHLLIAAALWLYALANIYSGGYHAWFGDSPMPAARETLAIVFFLGYILAFLEKRPAVMLASAVIAHLSLPTGGLWFLFWPTAVALSWRPLPRPHLIWAGITLALLAAISVASPLVAGAAGLPMPGNEFNAFGIIQRLRFVAFSDWNRFAFLAVPTGILPAFFLLTWRRQDQVARALTLVTLAFFAFFYLQGYRVLMHHFIPAMIPPLVIMWRSDLMARAGARILVVIGLLAGLWLAWPKDMGMHAHDRAFAAFVQTEGPRYASGTPLDGERFRGFDPKALDTFHHLFGQLLPIGYGQTEPGDRFFGAPLVWWYYSEYPKAPGQVINYVLKPLADATPADGTLFSSYDGYGLYIHDMALYEAQRSQKLPYDTGAAILATPREVIFGRGPHWPKIWSDRLVIDLVGLAKSVLGKS